MFQSIFDVERLQATVTRLLAEIPDEKRSGNDMMYAVDQVIVAAPSSIQRARGTLTQAAYLKSVKKLLQTDSETVVSQLKEINSALFQPSNFRVLVVADLAKTAETLCRPGIFSQMDLITPNLLHHSKHTILDSQTLARVPRI